MIQIKPFLFDFTSGPGFGEYYTYSPGFESQADFAGDILYITDKKTCIKTAVVVLCCILPCSSLSFVMALVNATKEHFYYGLDNPENMYPFLIRILVLYELIR
ncbi:hypothetical protein [Macellibacteroides fermentans]|uniref:Uncharacterized protein n=1 Tax=Macellibacteroides fermentans TaxID=879969 RepID=A0A8E1ZY71_9PORP|nr:hypothetical protein [Macellibacteroides fermentans]NYI50669.1 hypothetical protein [Macellibacteroides fermentans]